MPVRWWLKARLKGRQRAALASSASKTAFALLLESSAAHGMCRLLLLTHYLCFALCPCPKQLSKSGSSGERREKRKQIETQLSKYNKQVSELVDQHHDSFARALQSFTTLAGNVDTAKHKSAHIRSALTACKSLLNCHREHVKQLYLDSLEHKEIIK